MKLTYTKGNAANPNNGEIRDEKGNLIVLRAVMNPEDEAVMNVMAAAPDLLTFVKRVADVLDYYDQNTGPERDNTLCELLAEARAAIAKAKGA